MLRVVISPAMVAPQIAGCQTARRSVCRRPGGNPAGPGHLPDVARALWPAVGYDLFAV